MLFRSLPGARSLHVYSSHLSFGVLFKIPLLRISLDLGCLSKAVIPLALFMLLSCIFTALKAGLDDNISCVRILYTIQI